ncbi:hypothetical protein GCM10009551_083810 [Nocardiopsis tropica]
MTGLPRRPLYAAVPRYVLSLLRYVLVHAVLMLLDGGGPGNRSARRPEWRAARYPQVYTGSRESARMIDRENALRRYRG